MAGAGADPRRSPSSPPPPTDHDSTDLGRARAALLAAPPGGRRLAPAALRAALVDLHDLWLATRSAALDVGRGSALVAVGALGRRELTPWSVPALVLVHDDRSPGAAALGRVAADLGASLGCPEAGADPVVRTVGEAVESSLADLPTALGLLEVRFVAGDAQLAERLATLARRAWRAGLPDRAPDLLARTDARWERAGDVAHRLEPDLRDGRGGLHDLALLDALAVAGAADRSAPDLRAARRVLLDLRTELHRHAGRARDVLRVEDTPDLVAVLGHADHHELRRALGGAARAVAQAVGTALRPLRPAVRPRRSTALGAGLGTGLVVHGGEVTLARGASVARDPLLVLRLASAAARSGIPMAPTGLRRLADAAPELRAPWPDAARAELLALLGAGDGLVDVVAALDQAGLWGRLLPEWGAVRDLPPREPGHHWVVGRHLLEVTCRAAALAPRVSRPDLLLLAALVHDLGGGRAGLGVEPAAHVGRRIGLSPDDVGLLTAVVRHHRLLPRTVRRHDPDDPSTVRRVLDAIGGDPVLLDLLGALAEADARGTGPGGWTAWRAILLDDLVTRCRRALAGDVVAGSRPRP